jgi:CRISPR-associated protein Cas2
MWVISLFDLPVQTPKQRKDYSRFRKDLLEDGFTMMQFSVYSRHCASMENAEVHVERMIRRLPPEGEVRFLTITDKQSRIRTYWGASANLPPRRPPSSNFSNSSWRRFLCDFNQLVTVRL